MPTACRSRIAVWWATFRRATYPSRTTTRASRICKPRAQPDDHHSGAAPVHDRDRDIARRGAPHKSVAREHGQRRRPGAVDHRITLFQMGFWDILAEVDNIWLAPAAAARTVHESAIAICPSQPSFVALARCRL